MQRTLNSLKTVILRSLQHIAAPSLCKKYCLLLCFCGGMFLLTHFPCSAQEQCPNVSLYQECEQECLQGISQEIQQDTLPQTPRKFVPISSLDSQNGTAQDSSKQRNSTTATMTKSPIEALWKSIIPGWGQLYVESYWKAPVFFGGAVYCVVEAIGREGGFQIANSLYTKFGLFQNLREREFYRDTRDVFIIASAAVWALAAVDAFVGAHLYDFDVSDEIPANDGKTSLLPSYLPQHILTEQRLAMQHTSPPRVLPYLDIAQLRLGVVVHW
ncbi:MAG: hypothetical protein EAZ92_10060 [Candidatus Kapaibacterium sp.]|nr:MAG: hypothetical protein EAZ92_10060 [Candidatus Kapabacteria bacterium]